ncbi:hypothetical protein ANN_21559 [Periplaneta americana]|uniref:Mutator-like transposase domain-containing protein n=1 Tax=Periplaneta americana TaxID=6978 RepID=A0ABQ8S5T1_PERAM|nr:hypothetical protein ANN_21559 [Periplaneta americana]
MTSAMNRNRLYNVNTRLVYGMRSIGKGIHAAQTFCAIMNLPPPPARFDREVFFINESLSEIAEASMRKAAMETVELNGNNRHICGAFDGSWQKRGHTSLMVLSLQHHYSRARCWQWKY